MNQSGIIPTEYRVLIKPDEVEEITKGGIFLPDQKQEQEKYATTEGLIVDISPLAFTYVESPEWKGQKPKVGQRVVHAKYAGLRITGNDGEEYTLLNDKDICAVRSES